MNCPNCRHGNPNDARFCSQCAAPLTNPPVASPAIQAAARAAQPDRGRKTGLIVLTIVLLLFALGGYAALRQATITAGTPTPVAAQNTTRANNSTANAAATRPHAQAAGTALGGALGAGAKGGVDPAKAPDDPALAGQQADQPNRSSANPNGATDAAGAGEAASPVSGLLGALSSAVGGAHPHDPVDFHTLEGLLPSSLPAMQASAPEGKADDTMSIKTTSAHVAFTGVNDSRIRLSITDATAISGLAGLATMANANSSEQGDSYEKTETLDGRSVHETWDATARHGQLSLSVGERFAVDVVGDNVDMNALKNALAHIDLAKLDSMKDANPVAK